MKQTMFKVMLGVGRENCMTYVAMALMSENNIVCNINMFDNAVWPILICLTMAALLYFEMPQLQL